MLDELISSLKQYQAKWEKLIADTQDAAFFRSLQPTAVAWKTEDLDDFDQRFRDLRELSDQVHLGWVNERWLVTLHLDGTELPWGLTTIKLMQRRPDSKDPAGLDHVDFMLPKGSDAKAILGQETEVKWTEEVNGSHCKWLSIWFDDTEAKLRSDTVWDVCIDEMTEYRQKLFGPRA